MPEVNLAQIHPFAFAFPADRKASQRLQMTPFLPELLRKVAEINLEEKLRADFMHNSILVEQGQLRPLHTLVTQVAAKLGMETPEIYVSNRGGVNAFAFGLKRKFIVLTTSLVDMMDEQELRAIVAHELAHILCEHLLYRSVAVAVTSPMLPLAGTMPAKLMRNSVSGLLYGWYRAAEYTADRASLLVVQDSEVIVSLLAKLAGLPKGYRDEFSLEMFREQAEFYEDEATLWSKTVTKGMDLFLSHPEPVKRAVAIHDWEKSEQYKDILEGKFLSRAAFQARSRLKIKGMRVCPVCRFSNNLKDERCQECDLDLNPEHQIFCGKGHLNSLDWRYCHECREDLGGPEKAEPEEV